MKVRALCSFSGKRLSLGKGQTCETDSETAEAYIKIGFLEKVRSEQEAESKPEPEAKPDPEVKTEPESEPEPKARKKAVKASESK